MVSPVRLGRYQDYNPTRIKFQDEAIDIVENQLYSETCPPTEIIEDDGSLGLETGQSRRIDGTGLSGEITKHQNFV